MNLGSTITRLRTQRGLSQGDLAEVLGVSRQSVSKWETNASVPDLDKLVKLSQFFDISLDELVTGASSPQEAAPEDTPNPEVRIPSVRQITGRTIAGIIFLCLGTLSFLLLTMAGGWLIGGLILALPFLTCALLCLRTARRTGLWCGWTIYLFVEWYLRWATGIDWTLVFLTPIFTSEMNYMRLLIAWGQLAVMLLMIVITLRSFRTVRLDLTCRRNRWLLAAGWAALLLLNFLKSWGYPLIYENPALDSMGIRLFLKAGEVGLLALFVSLLTATVCGLRKPVKP